MLVFDALIPCRPVMLMPLSLDNSLQLFVCHLPIRHAPSRCFIPLVLVTGTESSERSTQASDPGRTVSLLTRCCRCYGPIALNITACHCWHDTHAAVMPHTLDQLNFYQITAWPAKLCPVSMDLSSAQIEIHVYMYKRANYGQYYLLV